MVVSKITAGKDRVDQDKSCFGRVPHGYSDGTVQLDYG
jgi:hypothetical protein